MFLKYLTDEKYDDLYFNVEQNEEKYYQDDGWLADDFTEGKDFKESKSWTLNDFVPVFKPGKKKPGQKCEEDLKNTLLLYEAFKELPPLQATNKYMWTYLCHADPRYREYIRDRWLTDQQSIGTIKARFFVGDDERSWLRDNALSRLWWYGHLTYDENESDHYALTKILLTQEAVATDVMGTMNRMNFERMKGLLLAIRDFMNLPDNDISNLDVDYVRPCNRYLNQYAAVTNLDYLDYEEIYKIAYDHLLKLKEHQEQ